MTIESQYKSLNTFMAHIFTQCTRPETTSSLRLDETKHKNLYWGGGVYTEQLCCCILLGADFVCLDFF